MLSKYIISIILIIEVLLIDKTLSITYDVKVIKKNDKPAISIMNEKGFGYSPCNVRSNVFYYTVLLK